VDSLGDYGGDGLVRDGLDLGGRVCDEVSDLCKMDVCEKDL
jgi:hypothetical protein